ncbi:MAG: thiamine-phosphate kinase [Cyanobacteriota bacterium]|nr:thiamine-phosphate kinase [Cyanobacteriota bacterium]
MAEGPTLGDLGEWELIRRLGAFAPPGQFADDAALVPAPGPGATDLVINTDVLVEGLHFSEATTGAKDVGWRAAVANLSDLAAMGCTEVVGLTVGLVAPATTPWGWVEGVYGGLAEALATYGGVLLGGDCSGGTQRLLAITALGRLGALPQGGGTGLPAGPIRRGDGRPGDLLVSSGPHGLSRLGLALLRDPSGTLATHLDRTLGERALQAHRRPRARLDAVHTLMASQPARTPWRVGGCDSSDGLAAAVAAVAAASGCGARLSRAALPLDPAMAPLPEAEAWCLGGGEDFELVLALDPAWARALVGALPGGAVIGALVEGSMGGLRWSDGDAIAVSGYRHFG